MTIERQQSASAKLGAEAARELAAGATRIIVAKGKQVTIFDMKNDPPDDGTLMKHLLGATGNLRAPAIRRGRTLLVGFNQDEYEKALG